MLKSPKKKPASVDLCLFGVAVLVSLAIGAFHLSRERFFYYWDMGGYYNKALELFDTFLISPINMLRLLKHSFGADFSSLFALPLLPLFSAFGDSRNTFILGMVVIYILPLAFLLARLAASSRQSFWAFSFLTILCPFLWTSTLSGFPDMGGTVLVVAAVSIFLFDPKLSRWWQAPSIGILLATAILFRRHYGYAAPAFFATVTVFSFWQAGFTRETFVRLTRLFVAGLVLLAVMFLFGRAFLTRYASMDMATLYSAYRMPLSGAALSYLKNFGVPLVLLTFGGLYLGLKSQSPTIRNLALFAGAYGIIWLAIWLPATYIASYYYACNLAWIVVLALLIASRELFDRRSTRPLVALGSFLAMNLAFGMTALKSHAEIFPMTWSMGYYATPRPDYDEVMNLVRYLRDTTQKDSKILVASSSGILNDSLLVDAERQAFGRQNQKLNVLGIAHIDSCGSYNLSQLLQAETVVVALPFQYHQGEEKQKVVRVLVDAFREGWPISKDFEKLPVGFSLSADVSVSVYKRIRPTSQSVAVTTFRMTEEAVGARPGYQGDWLVLSNAGFSDMGKAGEDAYFARTRPFAGGVPSTASFLYFGKLPAAGSIEAEFDSNNSCLGLSASVTPADLSGRSLASVPKQVQVRDAKAFSLPFTTNGYPYLILELAGLESESNKDCVLDLGKIIIAQKDPSLIK